MLAWLQNKMRAGRAKMAAAQLEQELEALSESERAQVLVSASEFALSFRSAPDGEGTLVSMMLENPSNISAGDAYKLYWEIEGILNAGKQQNDSAQKRMEAIAGADQARVFRARMRFMEIACRLVMVRLSVRFEPTNREAAIRVRKLLYAALPAISGAVEALKQSHSILGETKTDLYYKGLADSASLCGMSYVF